MNVSPRFILLNRPDAEPFLLGKEDVFIGRSPDKCQFVITGDKTISGIHASVHYQDGHYILKNLGQYGTLINDILITEQTLKDDDTIGIGATRIQFQAGGGADQLPHSFPDAADADKTVVFRPGKFGLHSGPRLLLDRGQGIVESFPLKKGRFLIGRDAEADGKVDDPSVSRRHCMIVNRKGKFFVENLSDNYRLRINDKEWKHPEKRLYAGDRIHVGSLFFVFLSDRPQDAPPKNETKVIVKKNGTDWSVWILTLCLFMLIAGYGIYTYGYLPWNEKNQVAAIAELVKKGENQKAREQAILFLKNEHSEDFKNAVYQSIAASTMAMVKSMESRGEFKNAKLFLRKHLRRYGSKEGAGALWAKLDALYLSTGLYLESKGRFQEALKEYAAIDTESRSFDRAQQRVKKIWMELQQKRLRDNTLAELLEMAEKSFLEKKYLTPVGENAYSAYKRILEIDPTNTTALRRIRQMKIFYLSYGDRQMVNGNLASALIFFERYKVIDPDNRHVNSRITAIRKKLKSKRIVKTVKPMKKTAPKAIAEQLPKSPVANQNEIKKILKETGKDNSAIMKFLFEDHEGEKDSETPWD